MSRVNIFIACVVFSVAVEANSLRSETRQSQTIRVRAEGSYGTAARATSVSERAGKVATALRRTADACDPDPCETNEVCTVTVRTFCEPRSFDPIPITPVDPITEIGPLRRAASLQSTSPAG